MGVTGGPNRQIKDRTIIGVMACVATVAVLVGVLAPLFGSRNSGPTRAELFYQQGLNEGRAGMPIQEASMWSEAGGYDYRRGYADALREKAK